MTTNGAPATCEEPDCSSPSVYIKRWDYSSSAAPPSAGDTVSFTAVAAVPAGSYLTFVNGLVVTSIDATIAGKVVSGAIPATIVGGQTYVYVTSTDLEGDFSDFDDTKVLFGPAVLEVKPAAPVIDYSIHKA